MEETCAIRETPVMAEVDDSVITSPIGSGTSGFKTLVVDTNEMEILESSSDINEIFERGTIAEETVEGTSGEVKTLERGSDTEETLDCGIIAKETHKSSSGGIETLEGGANTIETLGSGISEIDTLRIVYPNEEILCDLGTTGPSLDGPIESANHFGTAVILNCTGPHFDLAEDKELDPGTSQDISDNESPHEKTSLLLRPLAGHQIDGVEEDDTNATSLDSTENSAQEVVSAGCCPVSSTQEVVSTSAFASDHQKNEEDDDEATSVKFESRKKCSDVVQAVEILKTRYRLSDVTIRKNMITWSCWNIADMIRGPHKETTWWKGRSLPRRMDAKSDVLQEFTGEELSDDKEFHQEMAELCRKIDTRDRELGQILDEILQVAQQSNVDSNIAQTAPIEVLENQTTKTQKATSLSQSAKGQGQQTASGTDNSSTEALDKHRNPFGRMMRAIRRRFSRRNRTRKN